MGNGTRALHALGLAEALTHTGQLISTQAFCNQRGARLAEIDLDEFWAGCGPCLGLRRPALHRLLAEQVTGLPCRFGLTVQALQQYEDHVAVRFSDGSSDSYDVVVGADGVRSSIRRLEFGESPPQYRGQMGWRFITRLPDGVSGWTVFLGAGRTFLLLPVGKEAVYCYADVASAQPLPDPAAGRVKRLQERFLDFASPVGEALAQLDANEQVHYSASEEIVQQPWGRGRVVLIGDAAHAMAPNMASGAALAFEDALVLAEILAAAGAVSEIVPAFTRRRRPRIG